MNIKQAKARFTELTGYKATRDNFYRSLWDIGASVKQWVAYRWNANGGCPPVKDYRTTRTWVDIVSYLEWYMEVA